MLNKRTLPFGTFFSYLLLYLAAIAAQLVLMYGYGLNPFDDNEAIRIGSIANLTGYGIGFLTLYILYYKYLKKVFLNAIKNHRRTIIYVAGGFLALYTLSVIVTFLYQLIGITSIPDNQAQLNAIAESALFDKIALGIYAVILAPFVEEMVFRLGLMTLINNVFSNSKVHKGIVTAIAIIFSSFLFGYIHVTGDFEQIGNYAALGVILALVYYKTDNIYTSIFLHMVYNAMAAYAMFAG